MIDQAIRLLQLLSDGNVHSGTELGARLGVSRAAVWKLIQRIDDVFGIEINSIPGAGYVLPHAIELLSEQLVREHLQALELPLPIGDILVVGSTPSTNDLALAAASRGARNLSVWLAEHQSAGRGRRGKTWQSPLLGNIYCSLLWRFAGGGPALEGLSLVIGIAIAEVLQRLGVSGVQLKWPNDIWINHQKVGGVLIEITGDPTGDCTAIIGFGINLRLSGRVKSVIDQSATSMSVFLPHIERNKTVALLLHAISSALNEHARYGFRAFIERWKTFDVLKGKEISIATQSGFQTGQYLGLSDRGALLFDSDTGVEEVFSGEISVRLN